MLRFVHANNHFSDTLRSWHFHENEIATMRFPPELSSWLSLLWPLQLPSYIRLHAVVVGFAHALLLERKSVSSWTACRRHDSVSPQVLHHLSVVVKRMNQRLDRER